jgi:sortase A
MKTVLRWGQYLLFAVGVAALGYCAWVLGSARVYQIRESRELARLLRRAPRAAPGSRNIPAFAADGLIGRIEIPRLGLSAMLDEGTGAGTLRKAVGHIRGTAFPGEPGNIGIAGHRDTFFRPLRRIHANDLIVLDTLRGRYRYRVVSAKVVSPDSVDVLAPTRSQVLTLVTCYPFYYVGPAPYRFIVRARRVGAPDAATLNPSSAIRGRSPRVSASSTSVRMVLRSPGISAT